jgi:hypothetical protein
MIVTRELGFESLEEMQRARASEVCYHFEHTTVVDDFIYTVNLFDLLFQVTWYVYRMDNLKLQVENLERERRMSEKPAAGTSADRPKSRK